MLECFTVILADRLRIAKGNFKAYLFRMAHHKACSLWKRILRRREASYQNETAADGVSSGKTSEPQISEAVKRWIAKSLDPEKVLWIRERDALLHRRLNRILKQYSHKEPADVGERERQS